MKIALKIDVDTLRGSRLGVLPLARLLAENNQHATFFFSVGPDNMGRHIFRLLKPAFLRKMLHSNAPALYGWNILLMGTLGPGPEIGKYLAPILRQTAALGHEIGLHAWDHYGWQTYAIRKGAPYVRAQLQKGLDTLTPLLNAPVPCSAAPGWQADNLTLLEKANAPFLYNSDSRGQALFRPVVHDLALAQPQIPTTLPTYDELIGRHHITPANYNAHLLSLLRPHALNVLCIHAEAEGLACHALFRDFLRRALAAGHTFHPLRTFLPPSPATAPIPLACITPKTIPGREGALATQCPAPPLAFRPAAPQDCRLVFHWANDPLLLAHSFRTHAPIPFPHHQKWFADTLAATKRHQYIALNNHGIPIGYVRFEPNPLRETEISVYLAPAARGKHLSRFLLNHGAKLYLAHHPNAPRPLTAWVRMENAASLAAFRAAKWQESPPAPYLNYPAIRFLFPEP